MPSTGQEESNVDTTKRVVDRCHQERVSGKEETLKTKEQVNRQLQNDVRFPFPDRKKLPAYKSKLTVAVKAEYCAKEILSVGRFNSKKEAPDCIQNRIVSKQRE